MTWTIAPATKYRTAKRLAVALGCIALGYVLAVAFDNQISLHYVSVYQSNTHASQTTLIFSTQPYHSAPVIDLFGTDPKAEK
jgi:hypothetical protein